MTAIDLFIATPSRGNPDMAYGGSMAVTLLTCAMAGIRAVPYAMTGETEIARARAILFSEFMASGAENLLFVDDDLGWDADAVPRLLSHAPEIVGGAYPFKDSSGRYPVRFGPDAEQKDGLIACDFLPGGFIRIKRSAAERMVQAYASLEYAEEKTRSGRSWALFWNILQDGTWLSEDSSFCKRWRDIGGQLWLDPDITFSHHGRHAWGGNFLAAAKQNERAAA